MPRPLDGTPALVASNRSLLCFHIEDRNSTLRDAASADPRRMAESGSTVIDTCYAGLHLLRMSRFPQQRGGGRLLRRHGAGENAQAVSALDAERYDIKSMGRAEPRRCCACWLRRFPCSRGAACQRLHHRRDGPRADGGVRPHHARGDGGGPHHAEQEQPRHRRGAVHRREDGETHITNILKKTAAKNRYEMALLCKTYFNA